MGIRTRRDRRVAAAAAVAALLGAAPGASARQEAAEGGLPPLLDPAGAERHAGKVVFAQLTTPDLAASERFYGALFGWQFRPVPVQRARYAEAMLGDRPVGGLVERPLPSGAARAPSWLTLISTPDANAAAALVARKGGRMLFGPREVPRLGAEAVAVDPQGAAFGMLQSGSGDPPDVLPGTGQWIWSSLLTGDPDAAAGFYQELFGYGVYDAAAGAAGASERRHLILASDGFARASVNPYPVGRAGARPGWIDFVRVDDAATAASRAAGLGGRVLVPPHVDRDGNTVAVLADPEGAAFGVLTWNEGAPAGAAK